MRTRKKELVSDNLKPFVGKLIKENSNSGDITSDSRNHKSTVGFVNLGGIIGKLQWWGTNVKKIDFANNILEKWERIDFMKQVNATYLIRGIMMDSMASKMIGMTTPSISVF